MGAGVSVWLILEFPVFFRDLSPSLLGVWTMAKKTHTLESLFVPSSRSEVVPFGNSSLDRLSPMLSRTVRQRRVRLVHLATPVSPNFWLWSFVKFAKARNDLHCFRLVNPDRHTF